MDDEWRKDFKPGTCRLNCFNENERSRFVPIGMDKAHTLRLKLARAETCDYVWEPFSWKYEDKPSFIFKKYMQVEPVLDGCQIIMSR